MRRGNVTQPFAVAAPSRREPTRPPSPAALPGTTDGHAPPAPWQTLPRGRREPHLEQEKVVFHRLAVVARVGTHCPDGEGLRGRPMLPQAVQPHHCRPDDAHPAPQQEPASVGAWCWPRGAPPKPPSLHQAGCGRSRLTSEGSSGRPSAPTACAAALPRRREPPRTGWTPCRAWSGVWPHVPR